MMQICSHKRLTGESDFTGFRPSLTSHSYAVWELENAVIKAINIDLKHPYIHRQKGKHSDSHKEKTQQSKKKKKTQQTQQTEKKKASDEC